MNTYYNELLAASLLGRSCLSPQLSIMGEALGFPEGDIHATRFYRIFFTLTEAGAITQATVKVDGDLISPCSGYFPETLDEFDYPAVLEWCLRETKAP